MEHPKTKRVRTLRKADIGAERKLWNAIKGRQLGGFKFTRQLPIGPYFADFVCRTHGLVIEVDGSQHIDSPRDRVRDEYMLRCGYSVFRVPNVVVLQQLDSVCDSLLAVLEGRMEDEEASDLRFMSSRSDIKRRVANSRSSLRFPTPSPSPQSGAG